MDRGIEDWEEHCDTPTTSISHKWRGSTLTAKRAGREDGKEERVEEQRAGWWDICHTLAAAELHQGPFSADR